jgi:hypothetical protein
MRRIVGPSICVHLCASVVDFVVRNPG